jgi:hypothetical protein
MTITRVIRDGVEFCTIDETGESGMSDTGLARLCGVHRSSVSNLINTRYSAWIEERRIKPSSSQYIALRPEEIKNRRPGQTSNIKIISTPVCEQVLRHYALDSKTKNKEQSLLRDKFIEMGIAAWIQQMMAWQDDPNLRNHCSTGAPTTNSYCPTPPFES